MGKCVVCGKKGLFLRVNAYGRCKECDDKYRNEECERIKKEEENRLKSKNESEEKRLKAKIILFKIGDLYTELSKHRFKITEVTNKKDADFERKRCRDVYLEFYELLDKARNTENFDGLLLEYARKEDEEFRRRYNDLYLTIKERYNECIIIYKTKIDVFNSIMLQLRTDGSLFSMEWEKNISLTEIGVSNNKNNELYDENKKEFPDFSTSIKSKLFDTIPDCVITDIETSGLIYNKNSIIEIAAIKIVDSKVIDTYSSLIHRDKTLDGKIVSLTGITTQMLRECNKDLGTVMSEYREFVGELPLVGHNINSFDIKFINEAYIKTFGRAIENQCVDTLRLSYEYFLEAESHKLVDLANYANTPIGTSHRALGDCETTLYLYKFMMDIAATSFLDWSKKGKSVDETDMDYPKYIIKKYPVGMCYKYHNKLISSGYLETAKIDTILGTFKVPELKNILANNSMQTTGSKQTLIDRIIENIDVQSLDLPDVCIPTQKGVEHYEKYNAAVNDMVYRYLGMQSQNSTFDGY